MRFYCLRELLSPGTLLASMNYRRLYSETILKHFIAFVQKYQILLLSVVTQ